MATLNENVQSLQFFALLALLLLGLSLWENPLGGRSIRQRRGGIFHRLRAVLRRSLVLLSAGWILYVVSPIAGVAWSASWKLSRVIGNVRAHRLADFLQMRLVPFLLLDFLAWPFALDYLRAKARAEEKRA